MHFVAKLLFISRRNLHLRPSRPNPMSDDSTNLLRTERINFSMRQQHMRWHVTPLSFDVSFLENHCEYLHKLYIARNYSLNYMKLL